MILVTVIAPRLTFIFGFMNDYGDNEALMIVNARRVSARDVTAADSEGDFDKCIERDSLVL